jgi:hypothetical protein
MRVGRTFTTYSNSHINLHLTPSLSSYSSLINVDSPHPQSLPISSLTSTLTSSLVQSPDKLKSPLSSSNTSPVLSYVPSTLTPKEMEGVLNMENENKKISLTFELKEKIFLV